MMKNYMSEDEDFGKNMENFKFLLISIVCSFF